MVKKSCDKDFEKHPVNIYLSLLSNSVIMLIVAITLYDISTSNIKDSSYYGGVLTLVLASVFYISSLEHLMAGNYLVFRIRILKNNIVFWNMLGKPLKISNSNVSYIKEGKYGKGLLFGTKQKFHKQGLTIFLNDGRYFRVSPSMRNLTDLQNYLEKIALENNPNKEFIKPSRIKNYSKPIATVIIFYLGLTTFSYLAYAAYNIFQNNHTEISNFLKGLYNWPFNVFDTDKLNQTNTIIYENFKHIKQYTSHYPFFYPSLIIWAPILIWGPTLIINKTQRFLNFTRRFLNHT